MKRKLLSIVLALCLTLTLLPTATFAAGSYADTNGHWAEAAIERWSGYGILQGADGRFSPDGTLTRAQMATILSRLLALPEASSYGFTDVAAGDWFADAIDRCAAAGIMQGTGGKAEPNAPITREQAMVMLCRALGIDAAAANLSGYPDGAQVSAYAAGYVAALVQMGIVKGDVNGKLNPAGNITRAEIVTIIDRLITVYANVDGAVINAANGGTVLVTAKNVSIANAPEGTKVIAAKGADGLSVNGKPVAAGQTYIVPSSEDGTSYTPGTGTYVPHKHTWKLAGTDEPTCTEAGANHYVCACGETYIEILPALGHDWSAWTGNGDHLTHTHTCTRCKRTETANCTYEVTVGTEKDTYTCSDCGDKYDVVKNSVVRIGETGYATLAEAIAKANEGDTIVLLKDIKVDAQIDVNKSVIIEGAGKTITANNTSWATDDSYKHLLNIQNTSNVTIKNLTLDSNGQAYGNQAYNATSVTFDKVTMSNSKGAGLTVNQSSVTAKDLTTSGNKWGGVNVDKKAANGTLHFTLTGNSTLNEDNKIWAEKANGPDVVTAEGYYCHLAAEFYVWRTSVSDEAAAVANGVYYVSLEKALSETAEAETINVTLLKDAELNANDPYLAFGTDSTQALTIDGGNNKLTLTTTYWSRLSMKNPNAKLILKNMTLTSSQETGTWDSYDITFRLCNVELDNVVIEKAVAIDNANVTMNKVTINESHDYYALWITTNGQTVSIKDSEICASNGRAIAIKEQYVNEADRQSVTLNLENTKLISAKKAGVYITSTAGARVNYDAACDFSGVKTGEIVAIDDDYAATSGPVYVNGVRLYGRTVISDGFYKVFDPQANTSWYEISSANGLKAFAGKVNSGTSYKNETVKLTADIDLANEEWTPIGKSGSTFQGVFDGQGHTISNLYINNKWLCDAGLFGLTTDGEVKNFTLRNADVTGYFDVGAIAGTPYTSKYTNITLCGNVTVNGYAYVGGAFGKNAYANLTNITINADEGSYVKADSERYRTYVGGVVGFMGEGNITVKNATSNIDVIGSTCDVGGISGIAHYGNTFVNCSSSGNVTLENATDEGDHLEIGGIAGVWLNTEGQTVTFTNCSFTGTLSTTLNGVDKTAELSPLHRIVGRKYSPDKDVGKLVIDGATQAAAQKDLTTIISNATAEEKISVNLTTAGTYTLPSLESKSITISGTKDTVIDMENKINNNASNISFDGVTVKFGTEDYKGFQHTGKLTYKDCTITGKQFLYGTEVEFINCNFAQDVVDYNVWTYGAGTVLFKDCKFNCKGKSVLIYNEGALEAQTVEFQNCSFNASVKADGKAAIEIDSRFTSYTVTIDQATANNIIGFADGSVSNNSLWNVKAHAKPVTVTVGSTVVYNQ